MEEDSKAVGRGLLLLALTLCENCTYMKLEREGGGGFGRGVMSVMSGFWVWRMTNWMMGWLNGTRAG